VCVFVFVFVFMFVCVFVFMFESSCMQQPNWQKEGKNQFARLGHLAEHISHFQAQGVYLRVWFRVEGLGLFRVEGSRFI